MIIEGLDGEGPVNALTAQPAAAEPPTPDDQAHVIAVRIWSGCSARNRALTCSSVSEASAIYLQTDAILVPRLATSNFATRFERLIALFLLLLLSEWRASRLEWG